MPTPGSRAPASAGGFGAAGSPRPMARRPGPCSARARLPLRSRVRQNAGLPGYHPCSGEHAYVLLARPAPDPNGVEFVSPAWNAGTRSAFPFPIPLDPEGVALLSADRRSGTPSGCVFLCFPLTQSFALGSRIAALPPSPVGLWRTRQAAASILIFRSLTIALSKLATSSIPHFLCILRLCSSRMSRRGAARA